MAKESPNYRGFVNTIDTESTPHTYMWNMLAFMRYAGSKGAISGENDYSRLAGPGADEVTDLMEGMSYRSRGK